MWFRERRERKMLALEQRLLQQLEAAVPRAAAGLSQDGTSLEGFALCTDEDMLSLYAAGITAAQVEKNREEYFRYRAPEWPESTALSEASDTLHQLASLQQKHAPDDTWKKRLLERLVELVERQRAQGAFGPNALLLVVAHDCGDPFYQWMLAGVERLNSPALVAKWREHF